MGQPQDTLENPREPGENGTGITMEFVWDSGTGKVKSALADSMIEVWKWVKSMQINWINLFVNFCQWKVKIILWYDDKKVEEGCYVILDS